jgi:hypothetical protein
MTLKYGELVFGPERFTLDVCTVRLSFGGQKYVCVRTACEDVVTSAAFLRLYEMDRHVTATTSVL